MEEGWGRCDNGKFKREVRNDRDGYNWTGYGGWSNNRFPEYSVVRVSSYQVRLPVLLHLKLLTNKKIFFKKKKKKHFWDWVAGMCISVTSGRSKLQPEPRHNLLTFRKNTQRKVWHNGFRLPQEGAGKRKGWSYTKAQPLRRRQVAYWVDPDLDFGELWCRTPSEPDKGSPIMNKIVRFLRAHGHTEPVLSAVT